jgi:hypothetical protein
MMSVVHQLHKCISHPLSLAHNLASQIWGCDQDRSNHIVHEFFKSDEFRGGIPVIPGALGTLGRLAATGAVELVVVTSRQHVIQDATLDWLDDHYPGIFGVGSWGSRGWSWAPRQTTAVLEGVEPES